MVLGMKSAIVRVEALYASILTIGGTQQLQFGHQGQCMWNGKKIGRCHIIRVARKGVLSPDKYLFALLCVFNNARITIAVCYEEIPIVQHRHSGGFAEFIWTIARMKGSAQCQKWFAALATRREFEYLVHSDIGDPNIVLRISAQAVRQVKAASKKTIKCSKTKIMDAMDDAYKFLPHS